MRASPGPDAGRRSRRTATGTIPQDPQAKRTTPKGTRRVLAVGDHVRCERAAPAAGSWSRFAGRSGVVVSVNVSRSVNPAWPDVTEIGVDLTGVGNNVTAFFRPDELAAVDYAETSGSLQSDETASRAIRQPEPRISAVVGGAP